MVLLALTRLLIADGPTDDKESESKKKEKQQK